ncbi:MAG: LysR family transcriptional regulator [Gammaproteobacteria bacterium]|nr:LysR family transcriptional regulator [Gammaproteobacteria bacterium]
MMSRQKRLLPSMSMLRAFDAAARSENFTEAAAELALTQGAISRQVRALEAQLDARLFARVGKTVQLTEAGRRYAQEVEKALQTVRLASLDAMTHRRGGTLNLAILPTFGTRWLMPRFPAFLKAHPEITVNFATKLSPFDFKREDLHAAIHYGRTDWPNTESTFLMREETVPVGAPSLLRESSLTAPADLYEMPLLHLATRHRAWQEWFRVAGLDRPIPVGMVFEEIATIAQATVAGLGLALLPRFLIEGELERSELQVVLDRPLKSSFAYYLVTPVDRAGYAPVRAFREWLLGQIDSIEN